MKTEWRSVGRRGYSHGVPFAKYGPRMQQQLRFTKDQAKRLHRVTRANGVSIQAFAQAAVMAAVADAEAGKARPA